MIYALSSKAWHAKAVEFIKDSRVFKAEGASMGNLLLAVGDAFA